MFNSQRCILFSIVSNSLFLPLSFSISLSHFLSLSWSLSLLQSVFLYLSIFLSLSIHIYLSTSLTLSLSMLLSLLLSVSISISLGSNASFTPCCAAERQLSFRYRQTRTGERTQRYLLTNFVLSLNINLFS